MERVKIKQPITEFLALVADLRNEHNRICLAKPDVNTLLDFAKYESIDKLNISEDVRVHRRLVLLLRRCYFSMAHSYGVSKEDAKDVWGGLESSTDFSKYWSFLEEKDILGQIAPAYKDWVVSCKELFLFVNAMKNNISLKMKTEVVIGEETIPFDVELRKSWEEVELDLPKDIKFPYGKMTEFVTYVSITNKERNIYLKAKLDIWNWEGGIPLKLVLSPQLHQDAVPFVKPVLAKIVVDIYKVLPKDWVTN